MEVLPLTNSKGKDLKGDDGPMQIIMINDSLKNEKYVFQHCYGQIIIFHQPRFS